LEAFAINLALLGGAFAIFLVLLKSARRNGKLVQSGE
jgi:hypothetical protein